jgi:hypothetical protein
MKIHPTQLAFVLTLLIPALGVSQPLKYTDADTPDEAVGIMRAAIETTDILRNRCIQHDPTLQEGIDADLSKWRATERLVLEKTMFHWNSASAKEPRLTEILKLVEEALNASLTFLSEMTAPAGRDGIREYCLQYFNDLASGVWRTRTPKAYEYMEKMPGPRERLILGVER